MMFSVARPRLAVACALVILAVCAAGLPGLSINSDTRVFFSPGNEQRQALDRFEAEFSSQNNLMIALHARQGDVFRPEHLQLMRELTETAWTLPHVTRVDSLSNSIHMTSDAEGIIIADMVQADDISSPDIIRDRVLADEMLVGKLVAEDGRTMALNINVQYPVGDSAAPGEIYRAAREMIDELRVREAGLDVWFTGRVASSNAMSLAAKTDMKTLTPLGWVLIGVVLSLLLRSARVVLALYVTIFMAILSALGVAGWVGHQLNAATSSAPTVILGLGVASLLHICVSALHHARQGMAKGEAISRALHGDIAPVALTLTTTAIGFLTLNWADAPPFRELGNIVALGAGFCLLYGLLVFPVALRWMSAHPKPSLTILKTFPVALGNFVIGHRRAVLVAAPVMLAVIALGISRIAIDDNYVRYFSEDYAFRVETEKIEQNLTGMDHIEFAVAGQGDGAILDPDYFATLEAFEAWLHQQPKVTHVTTVAETFRRLNQHLNEGDPTFHAIPRDGDLLAQYLLLYEMSLPLGRSLQDTITMDRSASRVSVVMTGASTREIRLLQEQGKAWLADHSGGSITGTGTGLAVMFAYLSSLNITSMTGGTIIALIVISFILIAAFRSLKYGLISLIPNLLPVAIAFGTWGFLVGKAGVAVSAVGAITLGIIVDDTVHLLWRYLEARRAGATPENAVRAMLARVGTPMLTSSIVLMIGFGVLATSGFHITAALGALSMITIFVALVADLVFLPALLLAFARGEKTAPEASWFVARPKGA